MSKEKKKHTAGDVLRVLVMLAALGVFCFSGYKLYGFYTEYKKGSDEYDNLEASYSTGQPEAAESIDALEDDEALSMLQQEIGEDVPDGAEKADAPAASAEESASEAPGDEAVSGEAVSSRREVLDKDELGPPGTLHEINGRFLMTVEENGEKKLLPTMNNPINFEELQAINPDICGWLRIRGIDISYPLVQGEDNDFYLHRTFEKTDNFAGCLFLNYENDRDFTDQNTVIYGHNMKNGSMFGKLKNFRDEKVYNTSKYFWIFTPDLIYQYRILSGMVVAQTGITYQTHFTEEEFEQFLDVAMRSSELDNQGVEVSTDDRIVTLSTCTGDSATRFVVMGKLAQVYASKQKD